MVNVVLINPLPHHIPFIMPGTRIASDRTTPILITTEMTIYRSSQMQELREICGVASDREIEMDGEVSVAYFVLEERR
jgi:hypothetical protein